MKKNHEIRIKVSDEEMRSIKAKADQVGLPISSFVRLIAIRTKIDVST